jgi:integrase
MSVHKYKTTRGDVRWQVRWRERGEQHKSGGWPTKRAAEEEERRRTSSRRGDYRAGRTPFEEYADRYLDQAPGRWKAKTAEGYTSALQHARRYFGSTPVGEIRVSDCREFLSWLASEECPGLKTPRSVNGAFAAFSAVLGLAVEDEAILANPAAVVRPHRDPNARKFEPRFLTEDQVKAICAELPVPYPLMVAFMAYTGLRAGEVSALRIEDLDLDREVVKVHTSARKREGKWERSTPKSKDSTREVKLLPDTAKHLRNYLRNTHMRSDNPSAPLFPNPKVGAAGRATGFPWRSFDWSAPVEMQNFYRNHFKPAVKRAGLKDDKGRPFVNVRLHDLRHTYASLMLSEPVKASPYWISKQMGHSSPVVTLTVYAKWIEDKDAPHVGAGLLSPPDVSAEADVIELPQRQEGATA